MESSIFRRGYCRTDYISAAWPTCFRNNHLFTIRQLDCMSIIGVERFYSHIQIDTLPVGIEVSKDYINSVHDGRVIPKHTVDICGRDKNFHRNRSLDSTDVVEKLCLGQIVS